MMLSASLDTSFWNIAGQLGVVPYLFDYFMVYYCDVVEREIVTTDPAETPLVYPQAMLFQVLKEDGRLHLRNPEKPLSFFGRGEAHAIALAVEQSWVLLINDGRPLTFAQNLGIRCVSVPDLCVLLYAQGKISHNALLGYLQRLASTTSNWLIERGRQYAHEIAVLRGDVR